MGIAFGFGGGGRGGRGGPGDGAPAARPTPTYRPKSPPRKPLPRVDRLRPHQRRPSSFRLPGRRSRSFRRRRPRTIASVGPGGPTGSLERARRRGHRRRNSFDRREPGFPGRQQWTLIAYSADKGEKLLDINTGLRGGMGPPITYQIDGKQYVALMGGQGVVQGRGGAPPPPPPTPGVAPAPGAPPAPAAPGRGGLGGPPAGPPVMPKLLVFELDGKTPLPDAAP